MENTSNKSFLFILSFLMFFSFCSATSNPIVFIEPTNGSVIINPDYFINFNVSAVGYTRVKFEDNTLFTDDGNGYFSSENYLPSLGINIVVLTACNGDTNCTTNTVYFYYYETEPPAPNVYLFPQMDSIENLTNNRSFIFNVTSTISITSCDLYINESYITSNETTINVSANNTINHSGLTVGNYSSYILCSDTLGLNNTSNEVNFTIFDNPPTPSSTCSPITPILLDFLAIALAALLILWIFIATENPNKMTNRIVFTLVLIIIILGTKTAIC